MPCAFDTVSSPKTAPLQDILPMLIGVLPDGSSSLRRAPSTSALVEVPGTLEQGTLV